MGEVRVFADGSFDLVNFSYSGIDAVDHEGRTRILSEVGRVLRPKGIFWFSTLNKDGRAARDRPWAPRWPKRNGGALDHTLALLNSTKSVPRHLFNYVRSRDLWREGDGWSIAPMAAHSYGLVVHYTTLARQLADLKEAGFRPDPEVFEDQNGRPVHAGEDLSDVFCFNILARRPGQGE